LISGPTGSGKTTTLYSMLNMLIANRKMCCRLKIRLNTTLKASTNPKFGQKSATPLQTVCERRLRQDPNVIMVGEIRDKETAQLAVQAALTGHLVLSTIHTNKPSVLFRVLSTWVLIRTLLRQRLVLAMAQRLGGTLVSRGGKDIPVEGSIEMMIEKQFAICPRI
jgi:type II secretory ATPase GspE/PulE/Tfp pilus assembly ATPase PilB-like protein